MTQVTVEDIHNSLLRSRYGEDNNGILFRPTKGNTFIELSFNLLLEAYGEIVKKIPLVESGLEEFTATEKVLFSLFITHAEWER